MTAAVEPRELLATVRITQVSHHLERHLDRALMAHQLSFRRYVTLSVIAEFGQVSRADLARILQISPQAVGGVVRRLLSAGLVKRRGSEPGLPLEISITPAGEAALAASTPIAHDAERAALADLPAESRAVLRQALESMLNALY